ncbi:MAG: hypothetical protein FWE50_04175 [Alphaproteobacteria bacterium]|nr:hypothetical protein [Alphaproteobacteria bacterium]
MRALFSLIFGILMLLLAAGIAVMGGKMFDVSRNFEVNAVIFQPADLSRDRIEKPIALDTLSEETVRERLIKKFVHEYFYIMPDADDIKRRRRSDSVLARMSDPASGVFKEWNEKVAPDLEKMAGMQVLRRVVVREVTTPPGEYIKVVYDLHTWDMANDITRPPQVSKDKVMFIRLDFEKGLRQHQTNGAKFNIRRYLENGGDPATIFRFKVLEVVAK